MSQIDQIFSPFNDTYFSGRGKSFMDFARPQLEDQYRKAREHLIYALARNGLTQSSVGAGKMGDLTQEYQYNRQALEGRARDEETKSRQQVEQNRSDLVAQLHATADPTAAAKSAISRQQFLYSTPGFDPLGNLFQNVSAGLADATTSATKGAGVNLFSPGSTSSSGSSRVVT